MFNFIALLTDRPGVDDAVLQIPLSLTYLFSDPFPPNLQDIINTNR